ncbi:MULTISPECIES: nuclear transport factor 2 family protein [unclassified Caballeronia]|uniref:nuclear transport factor 2 family protein n=1 Tax=unclassified Caballeronia TaxID=2646786 RepID=UPI00202860D3|nr:MULTISPECIES: nuclear transport factor 2 family protein [unclassified Caballeronia]MDR5765852.1 nuclear transport factor 2 family protein [Caballeronia sp. LZ028]
MSAATSDQQLLERMRIREVLEDYLGSLDDKDYDAIANCFTEDAVSHYNNEPHELKGGKGVAEWLHRMAAYNATIHALGNARIKVDGDKAVAHSIVTATLHAGDEGFGRVQVRTIDYVDQLVKVNGEWKIANRMHKPTMQYDAPSQSMVLYKGKAK